MGRVDLDRPHGWGPGEIEKQPGFTTQDSLIVRPSEYFSSPIFQERPKSCRKSLRQRGLGLRSFPGRTPRISGNLLEEMDFIESNHVMPVDFLADPPFSTKLLYSPNAYSKQFRSRSCAHESLDYHGPLTVVCRAPTYSFSGRRQIRTGDFYRVSVASARRFGPAELGRIAAW